MGRVKEYTFKVVENNCLNWENIKKEFTDDYLFSTLNNNEIRQKYDLTYGEFKQCRDKVHLEYGITRRPHYRERSGGCKYYFKTKYGFLIQKKINGENKYIGVVNNETLAKQIVEQCKKVDWDINKCRRICGEWKRNSKVLY